MGVGVARGKLLFIGEHAAVHGYPCVGLSLPWTVEARLTAGPQGAGSWELPGLGPHRDAVAALLGRFATVAAEEGLPAPVPGRLEIATGLALASGLGSSGALCAALTNLFWPDLPLDHRDRLAWKGEALFHGTPSGIDTCLALREGWWLLEGPRKPVRAAALPDPGLHLLVGALVREGDTKSLVASVSRRKAEGDQAVARSLESLGELAAASAAAIAGADTGAIPPAVNRARELLAGLGLEPLPLTRVLDRALGQPGALAAKLSGAGGGGAFFAVFRDRESADAARAAVEAAAAPALWTCLPQRV